MQRRHLETAAASCSYLRCLFFIPAGVLFMITALENRGVGPAWAFPVVVAAAGAACLPIARYYSQNYWRLSPSARQQVRGGAALVIGLAVMTGGAFLMRSRADWSLNLPVNAIAVSFALFMLVSYAIGVGLKAHHVLVWGALLVAGALPVWNGADPSNIGFVLAGSALMASGYFDHRLFVRTFGSPGVPDNGDSDA